MLLREYETPATEIAFVLFVDMVGFSKLDLEGLARADRSLRKHVLDLQALRLALAKGQAHTFDTGDGVILAFFGDPTWPAQAACELWRSYMGEKPQLRMGMHMGPVIVCDDVTGRKNLKGVGMNVAQRVMDCAQPGSIYLTGHYAETLAGYGAYKKLLYNRGVQKVKHGLKLRVWELCPDGSTAVSEIRHIPRRMAATASLLTLAFLVLTAAGLGGMVAALWLAAMPADIDPPTVSAGRVDRFPPQENPGTRFSPKFD